MKTKILIAFIAVTISFIIFYKLINDKNESLPVVYEEHKLKSDKEDSPEKFVEYHQAIRTRVGQAVPTYENNYQFKEFTSAVKRKKRSSLRNITWEDRGPGNVPGRTRGLIIDPDDQNGNTWYAGSASGGLWKTEDGGSNWRNLTPHLPNLSTTCIAMATSNHEVIYAGTGETAFSNITGGGIFKSTDRGENWVLLDATFDDDISTITRLIVNPNDDDVVLASTLSSNRYYITANGENVKASIIKSTDGGETWSIEYQFDDSFIPNIQQIIADPSDFNTMYATVRGVGVLKSVNAGETWELNQNCFTGNFGRIELAIANTNTSIIYASVEGNASGNRSDLYVSSDAGVTWELVQEESGQNPDWLMYQANYNNTIAVNPYNDNIVYVGGINLFKMTVTDIDSDHPVRTTDVLTDSYNFSNIGRNAYVHVDQHNIQIIRGDNQTFRLLVGNDGGIWVTDNSNNPGFQEGSWHKAGDGCNTAQFYGVDKKPGMDVYFGGTQDNGTWISSDDEEANTESDYINVVSGDGFEAACHAEDPNTMIGGSQFCNFSKTTDNWETSYPAIEGLGATMTFISRLAFSKSDPDILFTVGLDGVYKSDDFGDSWYLSEVDRLSWGTFRWDVEVSTSNPQIVWAGEGMTSTRSIQVSTDCGLTFSAVNNYDEMGFMSGLGTHPVSDSTAFVLFSIHGAAKILRTYNLGNTWHDISGFDPNSTSTGFPDVPTYSILVMPFDTSTIWAGTEIGVFESTDNGATWNIINEFPPVSVWSMNIVDDQVIMSTYGRGIWTATIPELAGYKPPATVKPPSISELYQDLFNIGSVKVKADFRDEYDSVKIYINNQVHEIINDVIIGESEILLTNIEDDVTAMLHAYKNGSVYKSISKSIEIIEIHDAVDSYSENFDETSTVHITGDLFQVLDLSEFNDYALHSSHPYSSNQSLKTYLTTPLIIAENNSVFKYKDIALIEPGDPGSVYGDAAFYDFVIVEATNNSKDWIAIEGGYDAGYNEDWRNAYTTNVAPDYQNFVEHEIDLLKYFNVKDTILVRFRLYADGGVEGWGWAVDVIEFINTPTNVNDIEEEIQCSVFPNPAVNDVQIVLEDINSDIRIHIYDISGKLVYTYISSSFNENMHIDVSDFKRGVYIINISSANCKTTKKLLLK